LWVRVAILKEKFLRIMFHIWAENV
jgi:hypothetical protein